MIKRIFFILTLSIVLLPGLSAQTPALYEVSLMSFNRNDFSDISPVIFKDGILFCSDRRFSSVVDRTSYDGRRLYNFYVTRAKDSTKWEAPEIVDSERKTLFNNGPMSIAPDGKTVYFTSEVETGRAAVRKKFRNRNGIFIGELSGTQITGIKPFRYNSPDYETGHPSISRDGKYLYFASDMPGGSGGSDIWYCENVNGEWSKPVNMGNRVNTSSKENYPYMHPSGKLYFASDRPGGKGRLDVYATTLFNGVWDTPADLPDPINSSSDDFALVASDNLQDGYFSSNRKASDDIFSFRSTIIRKLSCDELVENSFCYRFTEENAVKFDTLPFRYQWKFGDGEAMSGAIVEHCYKDPGVYVVQLDVVNLVTGEILYNEKTDTLIIEKAVQPYISCPDIANAGDIIRLDASETNLPGWDIDRYYWNFGDETVSTGEKVNKSFNRPGTYNIQLIVSSARSPEGTVMESCVSKNITVITAP
ncbi:MAG TPA: PKD domain-containing protein [Bacteroidales bacterium]|nr:PKD domain-containing protein [Bacteroidales bacterium]